MPLMGSFYVGLSGLQTGQNALNTTAHNLSNIDTEGYTRQQTTLATRRYNTLSKHYESVADQEIGLGVLYSASKRVRDTFVDATYRKESGRSAFYEVQASSLEEVENLLGELEGENFQEAVNNLWVSIQELSKDPHNSVNQGLFVQSCSTFLQRATSVYNALAEYQDNLNQQIYNQVNLINQYGRQIQALNDEIRGIECGGTEKANDLRDQRDILLDELASMASISYEELADTTVTVQIEGVDFVVTGRCFEIALDMDETTGFYTPYWKQNARYSIMDDGTKQYVTEGAEVFDLTREVSSDLDTDIGSVKSLLLARGDHRADYTDMAEENYDRTISQSTIMNVEGEFDQFVHNIVTKINEIMAETGYMVDDDGTPLQMFQKVTTQAYDDAGNYIAEDPSKPDSLYTLKNLRVNETLRQSPSKLKFLKADGQVDQDTADKLKAAFTEEIYTLNPNVKKTTTFVDYYTDLVSQVANSGSVYRSIAKTQETTVEAAGARREEIVGVSSDEELSNMIKFQNGYNAASRYINVIDEMLEHLIQKLG